MRASFTNNGTDTLHPGKPVGFPASSDPTVRNGEVPAPPPAAREQGAYASRAVRPREYAYRVATFLVLTDWIVAFAAIYAGLTLREWQREGWARVLESRPETDPALVLWAIGGSLLFTWFMVVFRTYDVSNIYRMQGVMKNTLKSILLWATVVWACVGFFRIEGYSPRVGTIYCLVTLAAGIGFWRLLSFLYLIQPRVKEAASARVVVVGWNVQAANLLRHMRSDLGQLAEIVGCVPMPGGHFRGKPPAYVPVLGDYSALPEIVRECQADSIILADVSCSSTEIQNLISFCQREILGFKMIPQYFPALNSGLQIETLSGVPLLGVGQLPLDKTLNRAMKRGMDIAGALIGLAASSLVVPFFCLIVYLESPGPVIFRQRRTSRSGRDFYIYKIRSMRINAEVGTGAVWCKQEDPRRLKIGTFMRKTNIDELPQFWNVLKGDMSLVGPRPERPELIAKFKNEIPNYNARHEARAGLTGWAQVNGLRGDTDLSKRIEADLYYLENWSVLLDLYCVFATVFKTKNAY